jgi:hypothetical protein
MSKSFYYLFFIALFYVITLYNIPVFSAEKLPAFPGAEGFGRYTTGGRGGEVYHVTSLADDGSEGTLRWALNKAGKRTIVFDVSGTIFLKSALPIISGNVTIAGQTAPGDGICVADYPFTINASNVIIRFMRFRLGNRNVANHEGDGLGGMDQENIMVDHCSVSWSIDECLSVYGMKNSTVQWCIVSQSLRNAGHAKGAHGYGGIWGGSGASYHHNLMVHHDSRTPRLGPRAGTQTDERVDMRNNVIYNWGGLGCYGGEGMNVNIVNNYYKPGPGTKQRPAYIQYRIAGIGIRTTQYVTDNPSFAPMWHVWGKFYVDGNFIYGFPNVTADNWTNGIYAQINNADVDNTFTQATKDTMKLSTPNKYIFTTTHSAEQAYEKVLQYAGASFVRDWHDTLMINDTRNGKASYTGAGNILGIINSQEDNKPVNATENWSAWPELISTAYPTDTDRDGMPDDWEIDHGLNPNNPDDRNNLNSEGYTMLEVYMNSIVASIMAGGNQGGTPTGSIIEEIKTEVKSVLLAHNTYTGAASALSPWTFEGGYSITNEAGKTYSTGSEMGIKYSAATQYKILLPNGIAVDSITFTGYDNYADGDSYLGELNGTTYSNTNYVYIRKNASGAYTIASYTVPLSTPATGSLTFTFQGKQVVLRILLWTRTTTANQNLFLTPLDPDGLTNVFTINGSIVKRNVIRRYAMDGLPTGIYIVDKTKRIVRY